MTFDGNRVRIELADVMSYSASENRMIPKQAAEIWLSTDEGRIVRTHKPSAVYVGDTRAEVLRDLARWIEAREDDSLAGMVREIAAKRGAK